MRGRPVDVLAHCIVDAGVRLRRFDRIALHHSGVGFERATASVQPTVQAGLLRGQAGLPIAQCTQGDRQVVDRHAPVNEELSLAERHAARSDVQRVQRVGQGGRGEAWPVD